MNPVYMIDRGDDASEMLQNHIKAERGILNRHITKIKAKETLAETMKQVNLQGQPVDVYLPTLWEATDISAPFSPTLALVNAKALKSITGSSVNFFLPFEHLQLIDVIRDKPTHRLLNGDCGHSEIQGEQCGMCMDCLEKYLCYKLFGFDTEEVFLEDPVEGFEGYQRIYTILHRICYGQKDVRPKKQEIAIGKLVVDNFFADTLPTELSDAIEARFQPLFEIY